MCDLLKREFRLRNFGLQHHKPEAFCEAQWRWPRPVFLIYRLVMAGYTVFALIEYLVTVSETSHSRHNVIVFLTTWTYIVETTYFVLGAVLATVYFFQPSFVRSSPTQLPGVRLDRDAENGNALGVDNKAFVPRGSGRSINSEEPHAARVSPGDTHVKNGSPSVTTTTVNISDKKTGTTIGNSMNFTSRSGGEATGEGDDDTDAGCMPWYVKVYWVVSNMIQIFCLVVTVIYFSALFKGKKNIALHDANVHAVNSVMILIDVAICARPVRLLHFIHPVIYGLTYVVFSAIYWSQDHLHNVLYHNVLDWNVPGLTMGVIAFLGLIGVPLLQLMHFGIFRLRLVIFKKIYGKDYL